MVERAHPSRHDARAQCAVTFWQERERLLKQIDQRFIDDSARPPNVSYAPGQDFNGADSFTFKVNDGAQESTAATVSITIAPVNDAPRAETQTSSTEEDTPVLITLAGSDIDGDPRKGNDIGADAVK